MRTQSIPILLITGFLGVGKTTLLNHILKNSGGLKIGVIVNDFGDINIDSLLVKSQTDKQLDLSNGCICCSIAEEDLDDAISNLANSDSELDYIIIEASGLAEPRDLATTLRLMKNRYSHFDGLVTVVDALNFAANNKTHAGALENLAIADTVVISKADLITDTDMVEIEQGIKLIAPRARLLHAINGAVDPRLLLDQTTSEPAAVQMGLGELNTTHTEHLHDKFNSVSFTTKEPLDPRTFIDWTKSMPSNYFRAKGICYFGIKGLEQKFTLQSVSGRSQLKLDEWQEGEKIETNLVVIGTNLDEKIIKADLQNLVDKDPDDVREETVMDVYRYK